MKYNTNIKCLSVHDGDTPTLQFQILSGGIYYIGPCRLARVDTEEVNSPDTDRKVIAFKARTYLANQLMNGKKIEIEVRGRDKYGRPLVELFTYNPLKRQWENVNDKIINAGYAKEVPLGTQMVSEFVLL